MSGGRIERLRYEIFDCCVLQKNSLSSAAREQTTKLTWTWCLAIPAALAFAWIASRFRRISRELREETGISINKLDGEAGWFLVRDRCSVALIGRLISRRNADDLRCRVIRHIRSEQQPEL